MRNEKGDGGSHPQNAVGVIAAFLKASNRAIVAEVTLNGQGGRARWVGKPKGRKVGGGKRGAVKGWSLASRRRMRDLLMANNAPSEWVPYDLTLTVPPMPEGHPSPCIGVPEAVKVWHGFCDVLNKRGHVAVWRLEVQPRTDTKRQDIRGIEQPHWHLIGACPSATESGLRDYFKGAWASVLGERSKVPGYDKNGVVLRLTEGWPDARRRYLFDHSSKAKALQVAVGWGRHWGVIGRRHLVKDDGEKHGLTAIEEARFCRIMRRLHCRRVVDWRGVGGVNWNNESLAVEDLRGGFKVSGLGWSFFVPGESCKRLWHDAGFRREIERRVTRQEGIKKRAVWGLKCGYKRRGFAGQWFGAAGVSLALSVAKGQYVRRGSGRLPE